MSNGTPPRLTKAEIKLLLRLRQLRKQPPTVFTVNTYPLKVKVTGSWELLEVSGSGAGL